MRAAAKLLGLRRVREAKGLSQADLAARSSVSRWTISHLERGRGEPHRETTERLAEALGVEPAELAQDAQIATSPASGRSAPSRRSVARATQ